MRKDRIAQIMEELESVLGNVSPEQLFSLESHIATANRVFGIGAGRSGLMIKAFMMRLMQMGVSAHVAGETTTPAVAEGDWVIIGSASGETATVIAVAKKAKAAGASLALLTATPQSTLAKMADLLVVLPLQSRKKAADQSNVSLVLGSPFELALLLTLESLVAPLMMRLHVDEAFMKRRHANLE